MNARHEPTELFDTDPDRTRVLIEQHGLSPEDVRKIREIMTQTGINFVGAAERLGLLKVHDPPNEPGSAAEDAAGPLGVIEIALQRVSSSRAIVPRQGAELTPGKELQRAFESFHPRNEKVRALRTELLLLAEASRQANVVALLSASPGEGRSQLAAELAISFAQLGRRTILIDADLRRPRQHELFGDDNQSGLADALEQSVKPLLHSIRGLPHMVLCKAGPVTRNPLELLSDGGFGRALFEWRRAFEFVVIDTPPLAQFADALAVASVAGRVLVLTRTRHSTFKQARQLLHRLEAARARVLGAVMQDF